MSKNSKDLLVALVCSLFSIFFLLIIIPAQIPLPKFSSGGTTPRAIPKTCCGIMITMSLIMAARTLINDRACFRVFAVEMKQSLADHRGWRNFAYVMLIFGLSVVYYIGYCTAGFILTTLVVFPLYAFALGCRKPAAVIVTDILLTFSVYYSFAVFMNCYLPGWAPF